jgi:DNA replication and repair protein RecF
VYIEHLAVWDYRNFGRAELWPAQEGVTLLAGPNGSGKTNLLEAVGYAASLRSFRASPTASLVRAGCQQGLVSAAVRRDGRALQLEAEVLVSGRGRLRLNRQAVRRPEDFVGALLVTVFSPDDIELVKGGPQARRDYLDAMIVALSPKLALVAANLERALRQRNALLRSAGGVLRPGMEGVLDVWDDKVAEAGEALVTAREQLVMALVPEVEAAYRELGGREKVELHYERSWDGALLDALRTSRALDLRRGVTGAGPQRDELHFCLDGLVARMQASQGQQRSLALALRLGGHALVTRRQGTVPVLLLDDVFSELDGRRSAALAACLPPGQVLLTAAGAVPADLSVAAAAEVSAGSVFSSPPGGAHGPDGSEGVRDGS